MQADIQLQVLRNFPFLRLSLPYADARVRPRLLAFYGLLATLEESFYRASDPVVTHARLGWWAEELANARKARSSHPLSEQLCSTGALEQMPEASLARLLFNEAERIDGHAAKNLDELIQQCEKTGMLNLELELAIGGGHDCYLQYENVDWIRQLAQINGLLKLVRESFKSNVARFNWVPLNLCARFEVNRLGIMQPEADAATRGLFAHIFKVALNDRKSLPVTTLPGSIQSSARHWILSSMLQRRLVSRLESLTARPGFALRCNQQMDQPNLGDSWAVWRMARKLQRGMEK